MCCFNALITGMSPNKKMITLNSRSETPGKSSRRGSFSWDNRSTMVLLEVCADFQSTHGKKQHFKWPRIQEKFEERTGKHVLVGQLRNKMEIIKRQYLLWTRLKNSKTGLEMDSVTGKIKADPDWWDMKIKENSEYKKFRDNGVLPKMDELWDRIFGDSCDTEEHCVVPLNSTSPNVSEGEQHLTPDGAVLEDFASPNNRFEIPGKKALTNTKVGRSGSFSWDKKNTMLLLEICADFQSIHGKKQHFKWPQIQEKFQECTGTHVLVGQLRNRMEIVKRQYLIWTRLKISDTGLKVDPVSGKIEADPEWWDMKIKVRGAFAIAISGGSLIGLMRKLCEAPYDKTIDWAKWYIYWADERVVAKTHGDSNYKLAKEGFLSKVPIIPSHVHAINDSLSAEEAANDYEFSVRQLVRTRIIDVSDTNDCPKFDLILLGMGPDGHVASLFPNHAALALKHDWVTYITDSPKPPPERITFTLPVINSASNVAIVVTGGSKAEAAYLAISQMGPDSIHLSVPARMVEPTKGKLVWFLDKEAASRIADQFVN